MTSRLYRRRVFSSRSRNGQSSRHYSVKVVFDGKTLNANYVRRAIRETVNFLSALRTAQKISTISDDTVWIEVGPQSVCTGFVKFTIPSIELAIPSIRHGDDNWKTMAESMAALQLAGVQVESMRFAKPLVPEAKYRSYVKMIPTVEDSTIYLGEVFIMQEDANMGLVGGIQFRRYPRISLSRFFSAPDKMAAMGSKPKAATSQTTVPAPAAPMAAAQEPKPALSGHDSGFGAQDEQRKPPSANLPTTAPSSTNERHTRCHGYGGMSRRLCRRFRQCQSTPARHQGRRPGDL